MVHLNWVLKPCWIEWINKEVGEGFRLSPTLFNIYLDKIITQWQKHDVTGTKL
jgi:hypothetical protein